MTFVVKLLGGSHHGRKLSVKSLSSQIVMIRRKKKNDYVDWMNFDTSYKIEEEVYELKKIGFSQPIDDLRYSIETRIAYVKKNSQVKTETMWKFGLHRDVEIRMIPLRKRNEAKKNTANT
jgi:hypothetical protein